MCPWDSAVLVSQQLVVAVNEESKTGTGLRPRRTLELELYVSLWSLRQALSVPNRRLQVVNQDSPIPKGTQC